MKQRTQSVLNVLTSAQWFRAVGEPISYRPVIEFEDQSLPNPACEQVPSWIEAATSALSEEWRHVITDTAVNRLWSLLVTRTAATVDCAKLGDELHSIANSVVNQKWTSLPSGLSNISESIRQIVFGICLEQECAEFIAPWFFTILAHWFVGGHFPCGWRGDFPIGNLVVF